MNLILLAAASSATLTFQQALFAAIGTALTGLLTWLVSLATSWISSKIKDKNAAAILTSIMNITTNAVQATYQSYVESLKGTDAWTKEAQENALNRALNTIKAQLTEGATKFIKDNYGNVEDYIRTLIESILYQLKNKNK
jgi:hypothetical protein